MNYILWLLLANAGIMWLEYTYRMGTFGSFLNALPYIIIPIMIGQVGIYYGFRLAPNLLFAGAMFTLINICLRIVNSFLLGEVPNLYNWFGVFLLVVATFLLKVK